VSARLPPGDIGRAAPPASILSLSDRSLNPKCLPSIFWDTWVRHSVHVHGISFNRSMGFNDPSFCFRTGLRDSSLKHSCPQLITYFRFFRLGAWRHPREPTMRRYLRQDLAAHPANLSSLPFSRASSRSLATHLNQPFEFDVAFSRLASARLQSLLPIHKFISHRLPPPQRISRKSSIAITLCSNMHSPYSLW